MNMTMISLAAIAVLWFLSLVLGLIRGSKKAFSRMIVILICAGLAFGATVLTKNALPEAYTRFAVELEKALQDAGQAELFKIIDGAEECRNALLSCVGALVAPTLFLAFFLALQIVTWVISFVFGILIGIVRLAVGKRNQTKHHPFRAIIWTTLQFAIVLMVLLTPIACYTEILSTNMQTIKDSGLLNESQLEQVETLKLDEVGDNVVLKTYQSAGGNFLLKELTTIKVGNEKVTLSSEMKSIISLASDVKVLTAKDMKDYGEAEAEIISRLTAFGDSKLLPTIAGEAIYQLTDSWVAGSGSFMGVAKPSVGATFDPAFNTLLQIFHDDARNSKLISEDFGTLGEMASIFVKNGLFANLNDTNALVDTLTKGDAVSELVTSLGSNGRLKKLIPEITNIAMRAIGTSLKIPENADVIYNDCMTDIASAINTAKSTYTPEQITEQINNLSPQIQQALDDSGVEINVDENIIKLFATTLLDEFADKETVTAADVSAFFAEYAQATEEPVQEAAVDSPFEAISYTKPLAASGTETRAQKLAKLTKKISEAAADTTTDEAAFKAAVENAIKEVFTETKYTDVIDSIKTTITKDSVGENGLNQLSGLKSAKTMNTVLVTMEDILLDVEESASKLDSSEAISKEAQSISDIFSKANDIIGSFSNNTGSEGTQSLADTAKTLGSVLDALDQSTTFGSEQTSKLVTAVFQSDMVCNDTMKISKKEATKLAEEATKKNADGKTGYADTMDGISSGFDVITKFSQSGEQIGEDDVKELLGAMNPKIAGLLQTYLTAERLSSFGLQGTNLDIANSVLHNLFAEMGDKNYTDEEYDNEIKGLLNIFNIVSAATKNKAGSTLFGGTDSRVGKTASDALNEILNSKMICRTITDTVLDENGNVKDGYNDPFGLKMAESKTQNSDYNDCVDALKAVTGKDLEVKALAALIGVDITH